MGGRRELSPFSVFSLLSSKQPRKMKCNITAGLRFSDPEHSPEAEGCLSQKPPAALSPVIVVGLSSSLDQPVSTISVILTCPLCSPTSELLPARTQQCPLQPTTPQETGFKESLLSFTTSKPLFELPKKAA